MQAHEQADVHADMRATATHEDLANLNCNFADFRNERKAETQRPSCALDG